MKGKQMILKLCYKSGAFLKHNAPTILTVVGAIGVGGTAVSAVRATTRAIDRLNEAQEEKGEKLTKGEVVAVAAPSYIPTVLIGASTIACMFCANVLNKRQQAALISAYALLDNAHKEYSGKLKELYGEEADTKIREAIAKAKRDEGVTAYAPGLNGLNAPGEKYLFYEEFRGEYFEATMHDVLNAEYHLNRNFALRGCANLNEFYEFLGLAKTDVGEALGWSADEFIEGGLTPWIDFDHVLTPVSEDGMECYRIYMEFAPTPGYDIY
jgi:hypothetical protein